MSMKTWNFSVVISLRAGRSVPFCRPVSTLTSSAGENQDWWREFVFCCQRKGGVEDYRIKQEITNTIPSFLKGASYHPLWREIIGGYLGLPETLNPLLHFWGWAGEVSRREGSASRQGKLEKRACRIGWALSITLLKTNEFGGGRLNLIVKLYLNMAGSNSSRITSKGGFVRRGPDESLWRKDRPSQERP